MKRNRSKISRSWWYFALLLLTNLSLLLPNASPPRIVGALLLIGLLPGLSWVNHYVTNLSSLARWTIAAALSYLFTTLATLILHYLPGPIEQYQILITLNSLALLPVLMYRWGQIETRQQVEVSVASIPPALILIFLLALFLRLTGLHYSEFQGDEALAMIAAAEALEGHENALFLRAKGPGEVLLPLALWRLTGVVNELIARLPFALAALFAVMTIYLIGQTIGGQRLGWLAAGFFALNGFMVAFGRIVQYQILVVWLSAMAFFLAIQWQIVAQKRLAFLSGLCLGGGLLAHYDAILALPAISWLLVAPAFAKDYTGAQFNFSIKVSISDLARATKTSLLFLGAFLPTSLLFYLPYALDPQANRAGDYVGSRIGNALRNNLPDFFHFNIFYSSSYYLIISGILVLGLLLWLLGRAHWSHRLASLFLAITILSVIFNPNLLAGSVETVNLTFLPFALLFLGAFLGSGPAYDRRTVSGWRALIVWLAIPFLGYNFVVALGLTHIYTTVPAWSLLAAMGWYHLIDLPLAQSGLRWPVWRSYGALGIGCLLSTLFLWNSFVRQDIEYWQDYPAGNLWFYWNPYKEPPKAGFFGFAHRAGWKGLGQKIAKGELQGDYGSNEEAEITTWYTRGAPRACDAKPEFFFLADDLIDRVELPDEIIALYYEKIGSIALPNQKRVQILQQSPTTVKLGLIDEAPLAQAFDQSSVPAAFARSARGSLPIEANFGNLIQLIGYDLDIRRAYPGGRVPVTLYWQSLAPISTSYQVFTHLESDSGPVAQSDGVPVCWTYPTDAWRPGQIIADQHAILLSPDIPPGTYPLEVGLYLPDTFQRLDLLDIAGNPAGTSVTLTIVEIKDRASEIEN